MTTDPEKKQLGSDLEWALEFVGYAGSQCVPFPQSVPSYLSGEIPQLQDFVLFSPSPYLENFGVMSRVSSEERNCNQDGKWPAVVCRT